MVALWWFGLSSCVVGVRGQGTGNDIWEGGRDIGCRGTNGLGGRHMILMDGLHNVFSQHGEDLLLVAGRGGGCEQYITEYVVHYINSVDSFI